MKKVFSVMMGLMALGCGLAACSGSDDDGSSVAPDMPAKEFKVVVMLDEGDMQQWQQTARWAQQLLSEAQQGQSRRVSLLLEFKNQDAPDIESYMQQVAGDTTVSAIIGPITSVRADRMAALLGDAIEQHRPLTAYRRPMLSPTATDVEYQRKYAGCDYVWNMAECDISQLEILVASLASHTLSPFTDVTLLAPASASGLIEGRSAYTEWFAFVAEEYGLPVKAILPYRNTAELRQQARKLPVGTSDALLSAVVFIPAAVNDALVLDEELNQMAQTADGRQVFAPRVYCSDLFVKPAVAKGLNRSQRIAYEGVDLWAWPESGFAQAYRQHFGTDLQSGEAQFYDALCLLTYAAALSCHNGQTLNEAVKTVVSGTNGSVAWAWHATGMKEVFGKLQAGQTPKINGATGPWTFDPNVFTNRQQSAYRQWRYHDGQFITASYVTALGTAHSFSAQDTWHWTATHTETFGTKEGQGLVYPSLNSRWALLVAASKGWTNYRFQADVLAMYHLLRSHGYADDHIVLIAEDDLASSEYNKNDPGAVRTSEQGDNLYAPSAIDYKLSQLTPSDIGDILQGRSSQRLPQVISPTESDNVFIYWSSHGSPGKLDFGESQSMAYGDLRQMLEQTPHRKLLLCAEACYSGGLGEACEGLPGVMLITAANPYEESRAAGWSSRIGVYLTNGFTSGFQQALRQNAHVSLRDLYYTLARTVSGSHVKVYNMAHYGNIYSETMAEHLE